MRRKTAARRRKPNLPIADDVLAALARAVANGVPDDALGFFARWWQFESWLRVLVHLELRAAHGSAWQTQLMGEAERLSAKDAVNEYMASPDAENLLAYLDSASLLAVIDDDERWEYFHHALLPRKRWQGAVEELRHLRNRNAHCRRPHRDDMLRIELMLRDLEPGARRAVSAYNNQHRALESMRDPVVDAWVRRQHPDAVRLVGHADRQYGIEFSLFYSQRPWAKGLRSATVSGTPGYLWHARWILRDGRFLSPRDLWLNTRLDGTRRDMVIHLVQSHPSEVSFTLAAVDDSSAVIDTIRGCFDSVIESSFAHVPDSRWSTWASEAAGLDSRVQVNTALALLEPHMTGSIFGSS